jgi:hypothetical protein
MSPSQRQYFVLYRLAQLGYAKREHLLRACFLDVPDGQTRFERDIEPLIRPRNRRGDALIVEEAATGLLSLNRAGRFTLDAPLRSEPREAFSTEGDAEPTYFRGRSDDGRPIPYGVRSLPTERRLTETTNLDERVALADVLTRFLELEGGRMRTTDRSYRIERVEVFSKPPEFGFPIGNRKASIRPDGLILLARRDDAGALHADWHYLEYEETSTPSKKLDALRQYAQFFWMGAFQRLWNDEYRFLYDLNEVNDGKEVETPRFKVLVVVEENDGSGYLDGILREFRFSKDVGLDYRELGFPSDTMGTGQFLVCQRSAFVRAEHALARVWLDGEQRLRRLAGEEWNFVTYLG